MKKIFLSLLVIGLMSGSAYAEKGKKSKSKKASKTECCSKEKCCTPPSCDKTACPIVVPGCGSK
jgi:hypothetical protein